jgi:hypothetical protein
VTSGITDLLGKPPPLQKKTSDPHELPACPVLKTTGSSFEHFIRDEYATLTPVSDRLFSTCIDLSYTFPEMTVSKAGDEEEKQLVAFEMPTLMGCGATAWKGGEVAERVREVTLEVFANDQSASVQVRARARWRLVVFFLTACRQRCIRWRNG